MEWEKIFTNDISDEMLVSKIYKTVYQTQHPKNNSVKKQAEDVNRSFSKEDIQMADT